MKTREETPIISTKDLVVGYSSNNPILAKVNLEIRTGTITSIVGPNGSGKSTLLKTLARQLSPISGIVEFQKQDIWQINAREFSLNCAYVAQFFDTRINLTVKELVALGRNPHQPWWSWNVSAEDIEAIKTAMAKANVEGLANRYVSTLSGGERQRALIASALAQQSQVILLDEPIANLDFKHQLSVTSLLQELKALNLAVIVVLHDLNVIDQISDKVALVGVEDEQANSIAYFGDCLDTLTGERIKEIFDVEVDVISSQKPHKQRFFHLYESRS